MTVRGVVHDPGHRPIAGASVNLHAADSDFVEDEKTNGNGEFSFSAVPPGIYIITVAQSGFGSKRNFHRSFQYLADFAFPVGGCRGTAIGFGYYHGVQAT